MWRLYNYCYTKVLVIPSNVLRLKKNTTLKYRGVGVDLSKKKKVDFCIWMQTYNSEADPKSATKYKVRSPFRKM